MKQEAFSYFTMGYLNVIAMLIFMSVFVGVIFWIYRKSSQSYYQKISRLPLEAEEQDHESE